MPDVDARTSEIRELEAKLEQSLLALEHAETLRGDVSKIAALAAGLQKRLDALRGNTVTEHPGRRAAMLAYLCKTMAGQAAP